MMAARRIAHLHFYNAAGCALIIFSIFLLGAHGTGGITIVTTTNTSTVFIIITIIT